MEQMWIMLNGTDGITRRTVLLLTICYNANDTACAQNDRFSHSYYSQVTVEFGPGAAYRNRKYGKGEENKMEKRNKKWGKVDEEENGKKRRRRGENVSKEGSVYSTTKK